MSELRLTDLAEQVYHWRPDGNKPEWGKELLRLARLFNLDEQVEDKTVAVLGYMVSSRKRDIKQRAAEKRAKDKALRYGFDYNGRRLMTETLSAKNDEGHPTLFDWVHLPPNKYIEAVLREQAVANGRVDSNAIRLELVKVMRKDPTLLDLPTMKDVCDKLEIDPDLVGLIEFPDGTSG